MPRRGGVPAYALVATGRGGKWSLFGDTLKKLQLTSFKGLAVRPRLYRQMGKRPGEGRHNRDSVIVSALRACAVVFFANRGLTATAKIVSALRASEIAPSLPEKHLRSCLAGLQCKVDADWVANNGVFCPGVFLNDLATALGNPSKTLNKVADG